MSDPATLLTMASAGTVAVGISAAAALRGWQGWLELKRTDLAAGRRPAGLRPSPAARIELADLRERVRRLEAIANGSDGRDQP